MPQPTDAAATAATSHEFAYRLAIEWGGKVLGVILLLVITWTLAAWARNTIGRLFDKTRVDKTLSRFLGNMLRWVIVALGLVACLGLFGFDITSLAALVGAAGLTIGLAMQGSLSNLAAGIMLMLLRPFRIGDSVVLAGQAGKVDDLDLFHTKIDTGDNRRLIIPNGQIFGATIENTTHHDFRRVEVPVGVDYNADIEATRAALLRAAESVPSRAADKPAAANLTALGDSAVQWAVGIWVPTASFATGKHELVAAIKRELDAARISIPFPQMDLWFRNRLESVPNETAPRNGNGAHLQPQSS